MTVREERLVETFVELADTLVADFDVIDFLHILARRSVELVDASAAGIMLGDQRGVLQVMASSTEEVRLLELYELQNDEGPCLDSYRSGTPTSHEDLDAMRSAWPMFAQRFEASGFTSAQAVPLRLRQDTIGALNIFRSGPGPLTQSDLRIAQALADIACIGLLQERSIAARDVLAEQLQTALNSRIVLEQAKGVLAERSGLGMDQSFSMLRDYARSHGQRLIAVAEEVIAGRLDVLQTHVQRQQSRPRPGR